jgi:hypothetical protein
MKTTINGYLLVKPYVNTGVKSEVRGGISFVKHAVSLIGLELLVDYKDNIRSFSKGSMIYFKESDLGTLQWAKEIMKDGLLGESYILSRLENVIVIEEKEK